MTVQMIPIDQVATFPVTFQDKAGAETAAPAFPAFSSSAQQIASVSYADGTLTVTPVGEGQAAITCDGLAGELDVLVTPGAASAFAVGPITLKPV